MALSSPVLSVGVGGWREGSWYLQQDLRLWPPRLLHAGAHGYEARLSLCGLWQVSLEIVTQAPPFLGHQP